MKEELRAITKNQRSLDNAVMMSSLIPSEKYSCSGSPLRLAKGSTAITGSELPMDAGGGADSPIDQQNALTGDAMFFSACSPMSTSLASILPRAYSWIFAERQL